LLLLLAACGRGEIAANETARPKLSDSITTKLPPVKAAVEKQQRAGTPAKPREAAPDPVPAAGGGSRYTSLEAPACRPQESAARARRWRRCDGSSGYALDISEGASRPDVTVVAPNGRRTDLNLPDLVPGKASSSLGRLAEWRGSGKARALILRVNAAGSSRHMSDLVVVRLDKPACVVAVVPQQAGQNQKAREIADGELPSCIKG
jgi:hypothetical protein